MPLYLIHHRLDDKGAIQRRLVQALNQSKAIAHVVATSITCRVVSNADLIQCTKDGIEVEKTSYLRQQTK